MSVAELLPRVRSLSRADRVRLVEILTSDLAADEGTAIIEPNREYEIWSPFDAFDAAETMLRVLEETKGAP